MIYKYNEKFIKNAQELRKNMTKEEKHLWYDFLKKLPFTVNRQKNIGNYIVDFYISKKRIVIEIDGLQHKMDENKEADIKRDEQLYRLGIKVLRYTNFDVNKNFNSVCEDILKNMELNANDLKK
jgi:very-short-patch-repair endonuclease